MRVLVPILLAIICSFPSIVVSEYLTCPPANFTFRHQADDISFVTIQNNVIIFEYDKNNLRVHRYKNSSSVNLILDDTNYFFKARTLNSAATYFAPEKKFEVIGKADIIDNDLGKGLENCQFHLAEISTGRLLAADADIAAKNCLNSKLCQALGPIEQQALDLAKTKPNNFGPISVITKYNAEYIEAVELMIETVGDNLLKENNATFQLENTEYYDNRKVFASEGSFRFDSNLKYNGGLKVHNRDQNSTKFSFSFVLPEGFLTYKHLTAASWFNSQIPAVCAKAHDMTFEGIVWVNYESIKCRVEGGRVYFVYSDTETFPCVKSILSNLNVKLSIGDAMSQEVSRFISDGIYEKFKNYVEEKLDCHELKPSKYHV